MKEFESLKVTLHFQWNNEGLTDLFFVNSDYVIYYSYNIYVNHRGKDWQNIIIHIHSYEIIAPPISKITKRIYF